MYTMAMPAQKASVNIRLNYTATKERIEKFKPDFIVDATGSRSNREVEEMIKSTKIPYEVIGDAKRTGKMMSSIWAGNELGRRL